MHELVQSAVEAAKKGDKSKAVELISQVLHINPNDIEALLVLATFVDDSRRKRQILNRVLSLDATNKTAREMMLEMDRAEINAYHQHPPRISIPKSQPVSETQHSSQDVISNQISTTFFDKPRIFRYPAGCLAILYVFTVFSCCGILWFAVLDWSYSFPFLVLFLVMTLALGYFLVTTSSKVETDGKGIRVASRFRTIEMKWDEIIDIKIDSLRGNLILSSNIGESAKISTYIQDYRTIMELLQAKRPDLYTEATSSAKQPVVSSTSVSGQNDQTSPASPFSTSSSNPSVPAQTSVSTQASTPSPASQPQVTPSKDSSNFRVEKPLTFTHALFSSPFLLIVFYVMTIFSCGIGLLLLSQGYSSGIRSLVLAILFGLTALSNSSKVEVRESNIRVLNLLKKSEMNWSDIATLKSNALGKKLELTSNTGETLKISTQLKGYPVIVEILRQKRSDLFSPQAVTSAQPNSTDMAYSPSLSQNQGAATFTETRTFRKNFFKQYGWTLLGVFFCLLFVWMASISTEERTAFIAVAAFSGLIMIVPFFQVSTVKVEPNKLTIETFFEQKDFSAQQIKEIDMKSVQGRYGRVTNVIHITPVEGRVYPLGGFADGDEIMYGILINWWNTYRNN